MVVHQNKCFEQHSVFPNINFTNDSEAYVVDETTEEGKAVAKKIIAFYPYYDIVVQDGVLVDVIQIEKPEFLTAAEIDAAVVQRIRQVYTQDDEFKMLNRGIVDSKDVDYLQYRTYVQECKDWGKQKKIELGFI